MKVTLMFKSLWKPGQITYVVFVKILDCQNLPCVLYGAKRGAWNWESACFCTEKVFKYCQPNSKHYGIWRNSVLSLVCHHCHKSFEILAVSGNDVSSKHTRKAFNMLVSMDNTSISSKETWATWIQTFLYSHRFSHIIMRLWQKVVIQCTTSMKSTVN